MTGVVMLNRVRKFLTINSSKIKIDLSYNIYMYLNNIKWGPNKIDQFFNI